MPVTAKLSQKFYEKLGDEIANELVDWFNQVDATYRGDLRDLNELNFARFDAKLEQRAAELNAKIDQKVAGLDAKIHHLVAGLDAKIHHLVAGLDAKIDHLVAGLDARIDQQSAQFEAKLGLVENRLIKWMFVFWITNLGLLMTLSKLLNAPVP